VVEGAVASTAPVEGFEMRSVAPSNVMIITLVSSPVLFARNVNPPTGAESMLPTLLSNTHKSPAMHSDGSMPVFPPTHPQSPAATVAVPPQTPLQSGKLQDPAMVAVAT
jgi:hypothetical protein